MSAVPGAGSYTRAMDVAITGASGFIGSALAAALQASGARVRRLVRPGSELGTDGIRWDPSAGVIDAAALEGVDAVVNLAGRAIEPRRWNDDYRADILNSRVAATGLISRSVAGLTRPPAVLVSGSASGFYGDRGDEVLTEDSPGGMGFLAGVCRQWEAATAPASEAGIRVAHLRTGIVLAPDGGAMSRMLTPFKMGLGGKLGAGTQWWSWITLADEVAAIRHIIDTTTVKGPVNLTAPNPVTNADFTAALGHILGRPAKMTAPRFALRAAMGDFADEALLASQRILPRALEVGGFNFQHPALEGALRALLAKP